jgi:SNF2 family DNA or RNA helicase
MSVTYRFFRNKLMATPPLFKHQKAAIKHGRTQSILFDMSDPGTGKTRTHAQLFVERAKKTGKCALVLASRSLLRSAWEDDFRKYCPEVRVSVATAANRTKAFAVDADVYVTNHDAALWLAQQPPTFFKKFDSLIIDESSAYKHRTSRRSKSVNKIKKYFAYRTCMSGTPNTNSITELWHQMFILDDGARLGKNFFAFRSAVCTPEQVGPSASMMKWTDREGAEHIVAHLLKDVVIRNRLEDCIDMPENVVYEKKYHLTPQQLRAYKQMEAACIAEMESGTLIRSINAAGVVQKLLQIASGAAYNEDGEYSVIDTGRYELVAELVEQRKHCVVFFNWRHQLEGLRTAFQAADITFTEIYGDVSDKDRKLAVDHFQAGFYRVLLAHPASAAHGLTLTKGTSTIWSSPTYNLEHYMQGNRRIHRAGQKERTETINIVAEGTIEEKVILKLTDKNARQGNMLDLLQELYHDSR